LYVALDGEQERLYREMEESFVALVRETDTYLTAPSVLAQITRLRQITCSPALVGGPDASAKTEALMELVDEVAGERKVLIFTSFARYVNLLVPRLGTYNSVVITGSVSGKQREVAAETFREDPTCRVLIGTTGAMGEGLNLQTAGVVVFLDLSWTPAAMEQAVGRAYRRGQAEAVHVIKVVAANTVDEDILRLLERKQGVIQDIEAVEEITRGALRRSEKGGTST
jgi:SNF2 family DNA or RNA helicase